MNGVVFFLLVNFIVAMCFCLVFSVVATRSRSRKGALWIASGFAIASLSAICELVVAYTSWTRTGALGAFATVLGGMVLLRVGIGEIYAVRLRGWVGALVMGAGCGIAYAIYGLPRGTPLQAFAYQAPFAVVLLMSAWAVNRSTRRLAVDRFLFGLLVFVGLHFLAKAGVAVLVGAGTGAKDYVHTNYALISQSATAVLMVAVGLTLLAVLVLEIMAEQKTESEQDALSGLSNRRGFYRSVQRLVARRPLPAHCVILCDLDHFKSINDTYGHDIGDRVIQSFGALLHKVKPPEAAAGRIGGEEFAVFLPATDLDLGMLFAQALRNSTSTMTIPGTPSSFSVTASFGVAPVWAGMSLDEALRQADIALYEAKHAGRNRVRQALVPRPPREVHLKPVP